MSKCEWCGKISNDLVIYTDAIGDNKSICAECKKSVDACECRKCGTITDPNMMIDGLCTNCVQVNLQMKSKRKEEVRLGVDRGMLENITSEMTFTDEDYERWLTMGKTFSSENMKDSRELRRIWIMVKFNAAGIYDGKVISDNFSDIETLLDRNFSKLINNTCKILIGNTGEARKVVRQSTVIDYENQVYILKA
ncbi:MAG: hypothetical protein J6A59_10935 [Lachnospiraceae bacterium]|nr:hypothetical protein [Lachnospiraceae bacterium]